ncbi:hypothetical protein HDU91_006140 [Kappamyces sp. JEL0680]|nr:hypothetical protein HDU91_006140 [Kappamyces sp. JEL0680]
MAARTKESLPLKRLTTQSSGPARSSEFDRTGRARASTTSFRDPPIKSVKLPELVITSSSRPSSVSHTSSGSIAKSAHLNGELLSIKRAKSLTRKSTVLDKSFQEKLESTAVTESPALSPLLWTEQTYLLVLLVAQMYENQSVTAASVTLVLFSLFLSAALYVSRSYRPSSRVLFVVLVYTCTLVLSPNSTSALVLLFGMMMLFANLLQTNMTYTRMTLVLFSTSLAYLLRTTLLQTDCFTTDGSCNVFSRLNLNYQIFWLAICCCGLLAATDLGRNSNSMYKWLLEQESGAFRLVNDNIDLQNQLRVAKIKPETEIAAPLTKATQMLMDLDKKRSVEVPGLQSHVQRILDILNSDRLFEPDFFKDTGDSDVTNFLQNVLENRKATSLRLRSMTLPSRLAPKLVHKEQEDTELVKLLQTIWDPFFDVLALEVVSNGHALFHVATTLFREHDFGSQLNISESKFQKWILKMEMGYDRNNPYHNPTHAADVTQVMNYFITRPKLKALLTTEDLFACIVAAVGHDYMHPGFTNAFLVATRNPLALRYNDTSVLEHFHASSVAEIFVQNEFDMLAALTPDQKKYIREMAVTMIMATDMAFHFEWLSKFKSKATTNSINFENANDKKLVLNIAMKCSDINNLTKPLQTSRIWTQLIIEEFFKQGDQEKARGLPVSMFMDRNNTDIPKCQMGFIDYIVLPLYEAWSQYLVGELDSHIDNLKNNRIFWKSQADSGQPVEKIDIPTYTVSVLRIPKHAKPRNGSIKSENPSIATSASESADTTPTLSNLSQKKESFASGMEYIRKLTHSQHGSEITDASSNHATSRRQARPSMDKSIGPLSIFRKISMSMAVGDDISNSTSEQSLPRSSKTGLSSNDASIHAKVSDNTFVANKSVSSQLESPGGIVHEEPAGLVVSPGRYSLGYAKEEMDVISEDAVPPMAMSRRKSLSTSELPPIRAPLVIEGMQNQGKSKPESDWLANANPSDRFYGFENFGNTCYSNSVVQALYYCKPFRDCVLLYSYPHSAAKLVAYEEALNLSQFSALAVEGEAADQTSALPARRDLDAPLEGAGNAIQVETNTKSKETSTWTGTLVDSIVSQFPDDQELSDTLFAAIQTLFSAISSQKKQVGVIGPKQFMTKLKQENEIFSSTQQQDAHEMFNYLINEIAETLIKHSKDFSQKFRKHGLAPKMVHDPKIPVFKSWIHELFEGELTNETKCLNCESVTNRDEPFLDLSVDIEQNSSLSTCLRHFSKSEVLNHKNKFFCDTCNSLQEAEKKYVCRLTSRMKIKRLPNVLAVHLKRFKYQEQLGRFSKLSYRVCFTEKLGLFNTPLDESALNQYFGEANLGTGYLFLYTASDYSSESLLKKMMPDGWRPPAPFNPSTTAPFSHNAELDPKEASPPPILATQELEDEEGDEAADAHPLQSLGDVAKVSPRLKHREMGSRPPFLSRTHSPGPIDTKRPSLPSIHVPTILSPGPATSLPMGAHGLDPSEQPLAKDSSWGWFKKVDKKK